MSDGQWTMPTNPGSIADLFPPGTDLCTIAAAFTNPSDFNAPGLSAVAIGMSVFLIIVVFFLSLGRLYVNLRKLTISDLFVLLAMLLNTAQGVLMIVYAKYFKHQWDTPLCILNGEYMLVSYIWQVIYVFNQFFAKTATLMLFYQLFTVSNTMRWAIKIGILFAFAFYMTGLALSSYYAAPHVGSTWDKLLLESIGTTIFALKWGVAQGAANVLFDIYIFILPLPIIARLNLSFHKKMQVMALFTIGLLGVAASILSLAYRVKSIQGANPDRTFNVGVLMICNLSEMSAAMIVCTTPAFAGFIRVNVMGSNVVRRLRSTWGSHGSPNHSRSGRSGDKDGSDQNKPRTHADNKHGGAIRNMSGYIEMSDTWLIDSGNTTVDIEAPAEAKTMHHDGLRVVKTVQVKREPSSEAHD